MNPLESAGPPFAPAQRCGFHADVGSYGCLVLEMLTGHPPWHDPATPTGGFAVFQLMNRIVSEPGPPPMPDAYAMPAGLHRMLCACFRRDVQVRPTCAELLGFDWMRQWDGTCE